ncbi:GspH/FimT family pseudopilin [Pseudoalteromonas fenneropenaei]|uniref:Type II secretion system protein H n=1 Tax=Pseudoalteromonas fenneropenaei TaxID=1737459 RepID=A0ABV7CN03_9GAMM
MKYRERAFTLLEVMITIAILAIIAMFALSSNKNLSESNRAESFLQELKRNFMFARAKATTADDFVVICAAPEAAIAARTSFTCANDWVANQVVVFVDINGDLSFDAATDTIYRVMEKLPNQDKLALSPNSSGFRFDTSGLLNNAQATAFVYCPNTDNSNNRELNLTLGGTVLYRGSTTATCG